MTNTGKVFAILNVLLAVAFLAHTAPLQQSRVAAQKAIKTAQDKIHGTFAGDKHEPGLIEQVDQLEREVLALKRDHARALERMLQVEETGRQERIALQSQLAVLKDQINDAQSRLANWKGAISQITNETEARDTEFKELEAEVQQYEAFGQQLSQEISTLKNQLETAQSEYNRTMEEMVKNQQELTALLKKFPDEAAGAENIAARP